MVNEDANLIQISPERVLKGMSPVAVSRAFARGTTLNEVTIEWILTFVKPELFTPTK